MSDSNTSAAWVILAVGLSDKLTGRGAEIASGFETLEITVPSGVGSAVQPATWRPTGSLSMRTRDAGRARRDRLSDLPDNLP